MLFSYELPQNNEAFQGVEATAGDMAVKPGEALLRKNRLSMLSGGKNSDSDSQFFLSCESDI